MKLNFNFQIKGLDGQPIEGHNGHAGKVLANALATMNSGNSIKLYDWALKLWNNGPLEIDDTDADVLDGLIESSQQLFVIAKAPLREYIKSVKDKKK